MSQPAPGVSHANSGVIRGFQAAQIVSVPEWSAIQMEALSLEGFSSRSMFVAFD